LKIYEDQDLLLIVVAVYDDSFFVLGSFFDASGFLLEVDLEIRG
jgi:hypothetical protein